MLGSGQSLPSNASGHAVFDSLGFMDAITGYVALLCVLCRVWCELMRCGVFRSCYLVYFYVFNTSSTYFSTTSTPVCVRNMDYVTIAAKPSGVRFCALLYPQCCGALPYASACLGTGNRVRFRSGEPVWSHHLTPLQQ